MKTLNRAGFLCLLLTASFAGAAPQGSGPLNFDKSEYAARRAKLMARIPDGFAVVWGSTAGPQNNDFNYLCGVKAPHAVLIVDGLRKESALFYTASETALRGEGLSVDLARDPAGATGVEQHYPVEQFTSVLGRLAGRASVVYTPFRAEERFREAVSQGAWDGRLTRELRFVQLLKERFPHLEVRDGAEIIWDIRRIKSPAEIEVLREAGRIGVRAMIEVMKAARVGQHEYELSSLFEYACKRAGSSGVFDYGVIISSAENHPFLHYTAHNRRLVDGDFLVFDSGPDYRDYDVDFTVSFPINGRFTPRQRELYEACLEVSKACLSLYRPGISGYDVGAKAREILERKGFDLATDAFTRLRFFKEGGVTHHVGLATHDAGGTDLDYGAPFKPGQVFASDVFAVFPGEDLGVRVENTVLITETGCENLTPGLPHEIAAIEALLKRK